MKYQDEVDWKDFLRNPEKLFGYSYIYAIIILVALGLLYIWNLTTVGKNAISSSAIQDSSALAQDIPLQSPRILPPVDVTKAGISSAEAVNKGKDVYKQNCASCHGNNGEGDGATASTLTTKPRNFHSLTGWKSGSKVSQIYATLETGISGTAMASFNYMAPADRFALIHFIRSLAANQPVDSPDELKQLDARFELAQGVNIAGQIPIKKAAQIIVMESQEISNDLQKKIEALKSEQAGNILIGRTIQNPDKVVTGFMERRENIASLDIFIKSVAAEPGQLGFKPAVVRLTQTEWAELYKELKTIIGASS